MTEKEKFLSTRETARLLNLSAQTLVNMRYRGEGLPYHKIGRRVVYSLTDIHEFMEKRRIDPERSPR